MLGLENEYFTGVLTSLMEPHAGCSTSVTMLRAFAVKLSEQKSQMYRKKLTVLQVQSILNIVDCRVWHTASLEDIQPLFGSLLSGEPLDDGLQLITILYAYVVRNETLVFR